MNLRLLIVSDPSFIHLKRILVDLCGTSLGEDSTGEHWNKIKAKLYINKLETVAAYFACMAYGKKLE